MRLHHPSWWTHAKLLRGDQAPIGVPPSPTIASHRWFGVGDSWAGLRRLQPRRWRLVSFSEVVMVALTQGPDFREGGPFLVLRDRAGRVLAVQWQRVDDATR